MKPYSIWLFFRVFNLYVFLAACLSRIEHPEQREREEIVRSKTKRCAIYSAPRTAHYPSLLWDIVHHEGSSSGYRMKGRVKDSYKYGALESSPAFSSHIKPPRPLLLYNTTSYGSGFFFPSRSPSSSRLFLCTVHPSLRCDAIFCCQSYTVGE